MKILAIETSCDETAAAVVEGEGRASPRLLSSVVASQIDLHQKYGGVFPEIASRAHTEKIVPVIEKALKDAGSKKDLNDIDNIAVTFGPGLIGSLLVGVTAAKTLAYVFNKPIIPINHWEGHIYSNFIGEFSNSNFQFSNNNLPKFPSLVLIVSGGHTGLVLMHGHGKYQALGQTRDDAAGEAFDKVAKLLGLPYPGGPAISAVAERIKNYELIIKKKYRFPRPMINEPGFDFSFSGLKTAVFYDIRDKKLNEQDKIEVAYEFQEAIVETLMARTKQAAEKYQPASLCLVGGVSANKRLREEFAKLGDDLSWRPSIHIPDIKLSTDNAAMIGIAAAYHLEKATTWQNINTDANSRL